MQENAFPSRMPKGNTGKPPGPKVARYRAGYIPAHAKDLVSESEAALENRKELSLGRLPEQLRMADERRSGRRPASSRWEEGEEESRPQPPNDRTSPARQPEEDEEVHIRTRSLVTPQLLGDGDDDDSTWHTFIGRANPAE